MLVTLVKRNLLMHWRDRSGVFFSFLAPLILFVLYVAFLGQTLVSDFEQSIPGVAHSLISAEVQAWVIAGICFTTTVTTPLAASGMLIDDRAKGRLSDFLVAPVPRRLIVFAYMISAFITGLAATLFVGLLGVGATVVTGNPLPSAGAIVQTGVVLIYSCAVFSGFAGLMVTFIKGQSGFAGLSTLVGTLVGFLGGAYIPIGVLPKTVANVMTLLPFSPAATLTRAGWSTHTLDNLTAGAPQSVIDNLKWDLGYTAKLGEQTLPTWTMWAIMAVFALAFITWAWRRTVNAVTRG